MASSRRRERRSGLTENRDGPAVNDESIRIRAKPLPECIHPEAVTNFYLLESRGTYFLTVTRLDPPLVASGAPLPREIPADVVAQLVFSAPAFAELLRLGLEVVGRVQPALAEQLLDAEIAQHQVPTGGVEGGKE